ncbi:MAG: hypothetical protein WCR78_00350 [Arcobacteraceae bacterium]
MNYELLSKLAMEEAQKHKNETLILKRRNEIIHEEIAKFENLIERLEKENALLKEEVSTLKEEIDSLKSVLEFKKDENSHYSHYS